MYFIFSIKFQSVLSCACDTQKYNNNKKMFRLAAYFFCTKVWAVLTLYTFILMASRWFGIKWNVCKSKWDGMEETLMKVMLEKKNKKMSSKDLFAVVVIVCRLLWWNLQIFYKFPPPLT